ncbi:Mobile element protein [uncultured Gammaproteobacteria bacterium]|nr:Mobile element protein [uncultured Gammaproteobacteria bacterium]
MFTKVLIKKAKKFIALINLNYLRPLHEYGLIEQPTICLIVILINKKAIHWIGDITYIKTYQGWSYLASALDLASRQVVGWANAKLAQDALDNAINRYKLNTKYLMFHSDQGTQYSSKVFIDYCSK